MAAGVYGTQIRMRPSDPQWSRVNYGQAAPANLMRNPAWGNTPMQTSPDNPALPALWWVGLVIALILIRVLSSKYVR